MVAEPKSFTKISTRLKEVCWLFLKLGSLSFGGPAVYISLMYHETVHLRKWLDAKRFLDLVGATNLIPGPNATEMAIHLGLIRAGGFGLISAGTLFILPGMAATLLVAWFYVNYGSIPEIGWILYGIKPVVIGIVIEAIWNLGKKAFKDITTAVVGIGIAVLGFMGFNEIGLLFCGAILVLLVHAGGRLMKHGLFAFISIPAIVHIQLITSTLTFVPFSQSMLLLTFIKIGSVLFGSGYVLLAFLRSEFVVKLGWLNLQQIFDAVVAGQITPGPVFSSATFIGYILGGWSSALIATLGIFLPSFLFVGILSRILPSVRKSIWAGIFLDGVNASSLGLMIAVTIRLGQVALIDIFTILISILTVLFIFKFRFNLIWMILGGALMGIIYKLALA